MTGADNSTSCPGYDSFYPYCLQTLQTLKFNITQLLISNSICSYTVNVVIFAGGKFSRKRWQDISRGGNFHETTPFSFINAYRFYFRMGVIFVKTKTRKLPPCENLHVYSTENISNCRHLSLHAILCEYYMDLPHDFAFTRLSKQIYRYLQSTYIHVPLTYHFTKSPRLQY